MSSPPQPPDDQPPAGPQDRRPRPQQTQRPPDQRRRNADARPFDLPPPLTRPQPPRTRGQLAADVSLKVIALAAFVFGVAMHACVAQSILDSDDTSATSESEAETETNATPVVIATASPTPDVPPTETPLPDRTECSEIEGTAYRSNAEREFYLANCLGSPPE